MKELKDIDFDNAFKTRITEELPEFEEESWLKMEQKLRKRERLVYYRYASILLVLLSFGIGFYLLSKDNGNEVDGIVSKKIEKKIDGHRDAELAIKQKPLASQQNNKPSVDDQYLKRGSTHLSVKTNVPYMTKTTAEKTIPSENFVFQDQPTVTKKDVPVIMQNQIAVAPKQDAIVKTDPIVNNVDIDKSKSDPELKAKVRRKIPLSVAVVSGPDFSSTASLIGGKTGISFGAMVAVGLTKRWSVQTGIAFGSKNYHASAYDYTFNNPNANKANYSDIVAACKVIEIPLRASYALSENQKRSIELNAGLSSYLMVREQYVFKYTATANRLDRTADIANENQHYLSVVELSATYNIKLKNKKFAVGIEPYVKIPLTGIGEGNVPLKSSGVSLKLRYDFNKTQ